MEPIITIVGFLGAGKTTLLKHLVETLIHAQWRPFVVLNDYADAELDAQELSAYLTPDAVQPLTGSCICCDGINELRASVNDLPMRERGITLIEANGTSDASTLMGFLGVGLAARFLPPVQVSVVDVRNWQRRAFLNELEAEQIRVSSLVLLTHVENSSTERVAAVKHDLEIRNPLASVVTRTELDALLIPDLEPLDNPGTAMDHGKSHWSSCSVDLPDLPDVACIRSICEAIPATILRIKGCTRVDGSDGYTYFERCPDGRVTIRPYAGAPVTGAKLLTIGPGSEPTLLRHAVTRSLGASRTNDHASTV